MTSVPAPHTPNWYAVHTPGRVKMAETKRSAVEGKQLRELDAAIRKAQEADARLMAFRQPSSDDPAWCAAVDANAEAAWALHSLADPIVPLPDVFAPN